jgi:hypothetical protein
MGVGGQRHAPAALHPPPLGNDAVPIAKEAGWAPRPVWTGEENLASNGIRSPDRPARSEPLYRLSTQWKGEYSAAIRNSFSGCSAGSLDTAPTETSGCQDPNYVFSLCRFQGTKSLMMPLPKLTENI